ncbi:MAG: methyltransferase domain-containing protein [Thermoleophilia bacterium]|nr:methyltransferase domain-containing protein [Thermoleophilia bacterium]
MSEGGGVSPERLAAYRVLRRVDEGAFADRAFASEARKLDLPPRERGAAMRLAYGATQRRRTLDLLIDEAIDNPAALEPEVRDVLRLGAYELVWSDRVPAPAAVDQSVRLVRGVHGVDRRRKARAGLVNAVMRRLADGAASRVASLEDPAVLHSMPDWIAEGLTAALGAEDAAGVMAAANEPAVSALRWNPLRGPREAVLSELPVPWHGDAVLPEAIVLDGPFGIEDSPLWAEGRAMGQSRASMLPARALDPRPGERILDLCAAPGAKSTHLAALSGNEATIVCVELHEARAKALRALGERMGARLEVVVGDARDVDLPGGPFDAVLVDPPCTGLGVLAARPDARWRRRPEALAELTALQAALLGRALGAVRPGGRVVYSTCTLLAAENEDVVTASGAELESLEADFPGMAHPRLPGALLTLPHRHGTDGFFVARLRVR